MRRNTLIARAVPTPDRDWKLSDLASTRLLMIDTSAGLEPKLRETLEALDFDVARVIVEGQHSPMEFLRLLAAIPSVLRADVLWIAPDESAFLSAIGRGGDRILYLLPADQVRFYLEINELVTEPRVLRRGHPAMTGCPVTSSISAASAIHS